MIPEESDKDLLVTVQGDGDEVDTIPYVPGDSEDEHFNTAIDDTSDNPRLSWANHLPLHLSHQMYAFQWRK